MKRTTPARKRVRKLRKQKSQEAAKDAKMFLDAVNALGKKV